MERDSHDSVGGVEGLLHTVTVVDVDVNVQHPLVVPAWGGGGGFVRKGKGEELVREGRGVFVG